MEQVDIEVEELRAALDSARLQDLRQIAKVRGWSLKGTSKGEAVTQLVARLSDAAAMKAGFEGLPAVEQEFLTWLAAARGFEDNSGVMSALVCLGSGRRLANAETGLLRERLIESGYLVRGPSESYEVPRLYRQWLPGLVASALIQSQPGTPVPTMGASELARHADELLAAIEAEQPRLVLDGPASSADQRQANSRGSGVPIHSRSDLLSADFLGRYGYGTPELGDLARFLVSLMVVDGLCRADRQAMRLEPVAQAIAEWQDLPPTERQTRLRVAWLRQWTPSAKGKPARSYPMWNELDMALSRVTGYLLRNTAYWIDGAEANEEAVSTSRAWVMDLVRLLKSDVWYDFPRWCHLIFSSRRELFRRSDYAIPFRWHTANKPVDSQQMPFETWQATYGSVLEAMLLGPARWLGMAQVGLQDGRLVAFQRPRAVAEAPIPPPPADTLQVQADGVLRLRNVWQAAHLRRLTRCIAAQTLREREFTLYRLDPAVFRRTLYGASGGEGGRDAAQVIRSFDDAGFPLPGHVQDVLHQWQASAGRYHIYDRVAVIEFSDDVALPEIQAGTRLARSNVYAVSPRSLVVLQPEIIPDLLEELRRKGYSPQVIPA